MKWKGRGAVDQNIVEEIMLNKQNKDRDRVKKLLPQKNA